MDKTRGILIKKWFLLTLHVLAMLFSMFIPHTAFADENQGKTIKIGYYENEIFEEGATEDSIKTGYAYEYYQTLSEYTGWKYEYVYGEFDDLYKMLETGEIDLLAGISYQENRKENVAYPDLPMGSERYNLLKKDGDESITSEPSSLNGKRIGAVQSAMVDELYRWMSENEVEATVERYLTYNQVFTAFDNGVVDAILVEGAGTYGRQNAEVFITFGAADYYLCVNKNKPDLLSELNYVQSQIVSDDPHYFSNLYAKYYPKNVATKAFSVEELQWLCDHRTLRVGYLDNYIPFSDTDENGNVVGLIKDYIPHILGQLGVETDLEVTYVGYDSYEEMVEAVNAGQIDLAFPVGGGLYFAEQNGIHQSKAVLSSSMTIVYKGDYPETDSLKIAINSKNSMLINYVQTYYPKAEFVNCDSTEECLWAVRRKKADATIINGIQVNSILKNSEFRDFGTRNLSNYDDLCFGVAIENNGLLRLINRGILAVGAQSAANMAYKYTDRLYRFTYMDFIRDNLRELSIILSIVILVVLVVVIKDNARNKKHLELEERRNEELRIAHEQQESQLEEITELNEMLSDEMADREKRLGIVEALSSSYTNVYLIDKFTKKLEPIKLNGYLVNDTDKIEYSLSYEETCQKFIDERVYKDDKKSVAKLVNWDSMVRMVEERDTYEGAYRIMNDDIMHHYQIRFKNLEDTEYVICGFQNIDALVAAEEERNQILQKNLDIISSLSDSFRAIYYIDLESDYFYTIRSSNISEIASFIGDSGVASDTLSKVSEKLVIQEHYDTVCKFCDLSTINERLADKKSIDIQYYGAYSGWVEAMFVAAHRKEDGTCSHVLWTIKSISDQKEMENAHRKELEDALKLAEAANQAKSSFLFSMSHDIRTPMNAIMGFTNLLEKYRDNPQKVEEYIGKIQNSSQFLLSLINNVLEMARIESGNMTVNVTPCDVYSFNESIYAVFEEQMRQKNITFTGKMEVTNQYILCDQVKIREIFLNILSNAVKYTPSGGTIDMQLEELPSDREGYCLYKSVVTDTGIGMSEDFLPHLFEEFTREHTATETKVEGTGLGMPIVKKMVDLLGGSIEVSSVLGVGTTFTVLLYNKITDKEALIKSETVEIDKFDFIGRRILLAEDNDLNAEIAIELLSEVGFVIERAEDGQICVDMLKKASPGYYSLILMDVQMPNMDGYEATQVIRHMEELDKRSIPIIAMTANAFDEDRQNAVNAGMNGHIAKPIDIGKLMEMMSQVIRQNV